MSGKSSGTALSYITTSSSGFSEKLPPPPASPDPTETGQPRSPVAISAFPALHTCVITEASQQDFPPPRSPGPTLASGAACGLPWLPNGARRRRKSSDSHIALCGEENDEVVRIDDEVLPSQRAVTDFVVDAPCSPWDEWDCAEEYNDPTEAPWFENSSRSLLRESRLRGGVWGEDQVSAPAGRAAVDGDEVENAGRTRRSEFFGRKDRRRARGARMSLWGGRFGKKLSTGEGVGAGGGTADDIGANRDGENGGGIRGSVGNARRREGAIVLGDESDSSYFESSSDSMPTPKAKRGKIWQHDDSPGPPAFRKVLDRLKFTKRS